MEIEMLVWLKIPDTTAITAFHAIEKMGVSSVRKLSRQDYYKFRSSAPDFDRLVGELGKTDVIVNANKHGFTARRPGGGSGPGFDGLKTVSVLVQNKDDKDGGLLPVLQGRLGFRNISALERGVLWTLGIDSSADAGEVAREVAEKLLSNRHYQEYMILEGV